MIPSDMRRIAAECGVEIHKYTTTPGAIYVTIYPALLAKVQLFVDGMNAVMPSSLRTVVSYTSGAPTAAQGRPHDTSCTCETCSPPAVLTLDERRLREAQAGTRVCIFTATSAELDAIGQRNGLARTYGWGDINESCHISLETDHIYRERILSTVLCACGGCVPTPRTPVWVVSRDCLRGVVFGHSLDLRGVGRLGGIHARLVVTRAHLFELAPEATTTRAAAFASAAARANGAELADTCGTLTTQNTELLAENARLRRELERGKPKPKPVDRTTAWQPTLATGLIPRRGR